MSHPFQDVPLQIVAQFMDTEDQLIEVLVLLDHNQESIAIVNLTDGEVTKISAVPCVNKPILAMKAVQMTAFDPR